MIGSPRLSRASIITRRRRAPSLGALALATAAAACGDDGVGPTPEGPVIEVVVQGLAPLDPEEEGTYEAWVVDAAGRVLPAGAMDVLEGHALTVVSPLEEPRYVMITVEPPGDTDANPSLMKLLGGRFEGPVAELGVTGYLTPIGLPPEERPGVHVLGLSSDGNGEDGAPADAGLWLVDSRVDSTDTSFFQTLTPLTRGWTYEGWVVRDHGTPDEVWVSYGQFVPNNLRKARLRDDTGLGPFSGHIDYERALPSEVHYPGDDWIANPLGHPVPGGLSLPFDLNGDQAAGEPSRWTHVITIEPNHEPDGIRTEDPWDAEPFFLRPYRNAIGEAPPAEPRAIGFVLDALPRGSATILGGEM